MHSIVNRVDYICRLTGCTFLNVGRKAIIINGVRFLGTTLWSNIPQVMNEIVSNNVNDYKHILTKGRKQITPEITTQLHLEEKNWLVEQLQDKEYPTVVITHHLPSYSIISPQYKDYLLNCVFASACDELFSSPVVGWVCGHSHKHNMGSINGIPFNINPVGYPFEATGYNPSITISI